MERGDKRAVQATHARAYAEKHFEIGYIADRFLKLLQA